MTVRNLLTAAIALLSFHAAASLAQPISSCKPFNRLMTQNIKRLGVPAASFSAILPNGKQITCAQGIANLSRQTPVNSHQMFGIGSITKTFVATLVLLDINKHQLKLDETIAQTVKRYGHWLPPESEKAWAGITILQLLNMTSGMYSYTENDLFNDMWKAFPTMPWYPRQLITISLSHPSYFKPGHGWHYSDINYLVLGMLLEKIHKKPLGQQIENRLLKPFHIKHIAYIPREYSTSEMNQMTRGYGKNLIDRTNGNMSQAGAAGAMIARPSSLVKWLHLLFSGKILPADKLKLMLQPYSLKTGLLAKNKKTPAYGLGLWRSYYPDRGGVNWGYWGGALGYSTWFQWRPKNNILFVVSVNVGMFYHGKEKENAGYELIHQLFPKLYHVIENAAK